MDKNIPFSKKIQSTQTIYGGLIAGLLSLAFVVLLIVKDPQYAADMNDAMIIVVPIVALLGIFLSDFLYKNFLLNIQKEDTLSSKFSKYTAAVLVRAFLLEAPALLALVITSTTNNFIYYVFVAALALMLVLRFPTVSKFENDVPLTSGEKSEIRSR